MHVMQLVGRRDHGRRVLHFTIGANDPVLSRANAKSGRFLQLNAARRINHIQLVAGNTSPGFCMKNACCKYSEMHHRLQHSFSKCIATTASE